MALEKRNGRRSVNSLLNYVASISLSTFVSGFALGLTSPALPDLRMRAILTEEELSWFASMLTLGAMIGSLLSSVTMDKLGRRGSIVVADLFFIVSFAMIYLYEQALLLYTARLLGGMSIGLVVSAAPAFISEISTDDVRGKLGSYTQLAFTIGIAIAFLVDIALEGGYVTISAVGFVLTCLALLRLLVLWDSPHWYASIGRRQLAIECLSNFRSSKEAAEKELQDLGLLDCRQFASPAISATAFSFIKNTRRLLSTIQEDTLRKPLLVCVGLTAVQQLSGISAVTFYASNIVSTNADSLNALAIAVAQVLATFVASTLIEQAGRKRLLRISLLVMSASCFLLAAYYLSVPQSVIGGASVSASWWLGASAVLPLLFYIIGYSIGCGPIPTILMSEFFEMRCRAVACSITVFASWLFSFLLTLYFTSFVTAFGRAAVFSIFGFVSVFGIYFVYRFVPETRNKSFAEIQAFF